MAQLVECLSGDLTPFMVHSGSVGRVLDWRSNSTLWSTVAQFVEC